MTQCNGMNCGTTTGNHSPECRAEHAAAVAGGRFVKGDGGARTPAALWREKGESDPHGSDYDGERAALVLGKLTDDELANGVFMNGDKPMDIARVLARDPDYHPPIVWLTAAKERIRWLSRALLRASDSATASDKE